MPETPEDTAARLLADRDEWQDHATKLTVEIDLLRDHLATAHESIQAYRTERSYLLHAIGEFLVVFDRDWSQGVSRRIVNAAERLRNDHAVLSAWEPPAAPTHQEPVEPPKNEDHPHTGGKGFNSP